MVLLFALYLQLQHIKKVRNTLNNLFLLIVSIFNKSYFLVSVIYACHRDMLLLRTKWETKGMKMNRGADKDVLHGTSFSMTDARADSVSLQN